MLIVCMWAAENKKDAKHEQFGNWVASVAMVPVTAHYSGVGTNFVLGGPRCIGRGGPKQHYIIMSNKINKARIHTWYSIIYTITWSLIIGGGGRPPLLDYWGSQWPHPPSSYSTVLCMVLSLGAKLLLCIAYRQSGDMPPTPRKV